MRWLEGNPNESFYIYYSIFLAFFLLYYGFCLGYFAQTFGMWFWGILIVKKDKSEVFFLRAFFFTVLMLIFGILSPLFVFLVKRSLHGLLTGTMLVKVAARPKA